MITMHDLISMTSSEISALFATLNKTNKGELKQIKYELLVLLSSLIIKNDNIKKNLADDSDCINSRLCDIPTKQISIQFFSLLELVDEKIKSFQCNKWEMLSETQKAALFCFEKELRALSEAQLTGSLYTELKKEYVRSCLIYKQFSQLKKQEGISIEALSTLQKKQRQTYIDSIYPKIKLQIIGNQLLQYKVSRIVSLPLPMRMATEQVNRELKSQLDDVKLKELHQKYLQQNRTSCDKRIEIARLKNENKCLLLAEENIHKRREIKNTINKLEMSDRKHNHLQTQAKILIIDIELLLSDLVIHKTQLALFPYDNTTDIHPSPISVVNGQGFPVPSVVLVNIQQTEICVAPKPVRVNYGSTVGVNTFFPSPIRPQTPSLESSETVSSGFF